MIIDCLSDLHGDYPELPGGDLLLIAGDLFANNNPRCRIDFTNWVTQVPYREVVYIAGNHDNLLVGEAPFCVSPIEDVGRPDISYLCDSGVEYEGLKIWGSPWTRQFDGMNPECMAFTVEDENDLADKWDMIPDCIDILITHAPPHGILDGSLNRARYGSPSLYAQLHNEHLKPRLHVFGHIHEGYGHYAKMRDMPYTQFVNAAHNTRDYDPINPPIRIYFNHGKNRA